MPSNLTYKKPCRREMLEISRSTYAGYESGKFAPSLEIALKIKKILNYKSDDIFLNEKVS